MKQDLGFIDKDFVDNVSDYFERNYVEYSVLYVYWFFYIRFKNEDW